MAKCLKFAAEDAFACFDVTVLDIAVVVAVVAAVMVVAAVAASK